MDLKPRRIRLTEEEYQLIRKMRHRESYKRNPRVRKSYNNTVEERRKELDLLRTACLKCGCKDYRIINLHHLNKSKSSQVIPLCFNCHMLYHRIAGQRAVAETIDDVLKVIC